MRGPGSAAYERAARGGLPTSDLRSARFRNDAVLKAVAAGHVRLGRPGDPSYPAPIRSSGTSVARVDYAPVAYTTVSKVTSILCDKDLLIRRLEDRAGKPGPAAWWYRAPRSMNEHIGELIAQLMDYSPDPEAALAYAMAARQRTPTDQP